ncbi:uncharacterized protein LOC105431724 [Pogonomyrmex barbatus]|uniref:Uncharacterized protein LOC105431724 n=1 Tax=Pogonomyrmex barbatus TaxID=144034 RepID=A0A6I9WM40_9HYME|nr:uncharacterized protein LOC105431724 [Pogonomyrmex barbatus]
MAMVRPLFFLSMAFFALVEVRAAPTRYDQRQEGVYNIRADLENFLLVVTLPSSKEFNTFASTALEGLQQELLQLARSSSFKDQESIKFGEQIHEEPYTVQVIQINENPANKESSVRKTEEGDAGTSNISDQQSTSVNEGQTEETRSVERIAKNLKNFDFPKSREVPAILGYFVDARKLLGSKMGNAGQARNVVGNVWNPDVESGRPGTSLKKQLPRRGEENVALPSSNVDKNDVSLTFPEEKQQELRLLGDGVENCGPGRRRDASGLCQFDESAGSLL